MTIDPMGTQSVSLLSGQPNGAFIAIISGSSLVPVTGLKIGKQPLASEPSKNSGADIKNSCCIFRVPGISSTESATLTYFIDLD